MENTKVDAGDNATYMEDENTCYVCDGSKYVYRLEGLRFSDSVDESAFFKDRNDAVEMGRYHVIRGHWCDWKLFAYSMKCTYTNYELNDCPIWTSTHDRSNNTPEALDCLKCFWHKGIPTFEHLFPIGWVYRICGDFYVVLERSPEEVTLRRFELCLPYFGSCNYNETLNDNEFRIHLHGGLIVGMSGIYDAVGRVYPQNPKYPGVILKEHPKQLSQFVDIRMIGDSHGFDVSKWKS